MMHKIGYLIEVYTGYLKEVYTTRWYFGCCVFFRQREVDTQILCPPVDCQTMSPLSGAGR